MVRISRINNHVEVTKHGENVQLNVFAEGERETHTHSLKVSVRHTLQSIDKDSSMYVP